MVILRALSISVVAILVSFLISGSALRQFIEISDFQYHRSPAADESNHYYDYIFTVTTDRDLAFASFDVLFYNSRREYIGKGVSSLEMPKGDLKVCGTALLSDVAATAEIIIADYETANYAIRWPYLTFSGIQMTRNAASDRTNFIYDYLFTANSMQEAKVVFTVLFYDGLGNFLGYSEEYQKLDKGANKISGTAALAGQAIMIEIFMSGTE